MVSINVLFYSVNLPLMLTLISLSYHINNRELSRVTDCHNLDVIFTENLSWHPYYEAIIAKAYKLLGLLK